MEEIVGQGKWTPPTTHQRSVFNQRSWYCVYSGIESESSTINSFQKTKQLQQVQLQIKPTEILLMEKIQFFGRPYKALGTN